ALCEVVAFEYIRSWIAGRVAAALAAHCTLSPRALAWWTEAAGVDCRHIERGLDELEAYVRFYEIDSEDAWAIVATTLGGNIFIERYLGGGAATSVRAGRHG